MKANLFFAMLLCANALHAQNFWQPVLPSVPYVLNIAANSRGHLFATSYGGVYRSTDGGITWVQINAGLWGPYATGLAVNPVNDDLFVSSAPRIYRSTNEGGIWLLQDSTTFSNGAWRLASNNQGILFAISDTLRRSNDSGRTWAIVHNGLPYGSMQDLRIHSNGEIAVARKGDWLFRSTDNGGNWIALPRPIGPPFFDADAIAFGPRDEIYVGDDGDGFFKSTDGGSSWAQLNGGLPNTFVWAVAVTNGGDIFAGMANGGVYRSTNGGAQWDSVNTGLDPSSRRIYSLFVASGGHVFAGTVNGLYRSTQPMTDVGEGLSNLAIQYSLFQNYPNPFNPRTVIRYATPILGRIDLSIYDLLGREVAILQNGIQQAGVHEVGWNASALPSGVYFYRLQAGSFAEIKKLLLLR